MVPAMLHRLVCLTPALLLSCATPEEGTSTSASESSTETDSDSDGQDSDASPTGGEEGGQACVPGKAESCPCVGGGEGVQVCLPSGQGYGACDCPDPTGGMSGEATTSDPPGTTDAEATTTTSGEATTTTGTTGDPSTSTGDATTGAPPVMCEDPDDAPGLEDDALEIADEGCFDQPKMFAGVLAGDADADWYTYHGECFQQPEVLHNLEASGDVRLCVFIDCDMGDPAFQCGNGSQANMSPNGLPGCCHDASISFDLNCMGGGENAQVYVRLDMGEADACTDYTVEYSYNDGF